MNLRIAFEFKSPACSSRFSSPPSAGNGLQSAKGRRFPIFPQNIFLLNFPAIVISSQLYLSNIISLILVINQLDAQNLLL
jgi:hypothetical protein